MTTAKQVRCPNCGAAVTWGPQSPFRPFCSERCRQVDLGAWAAGDYRVPAEAPPDEFDLPDINPTLRG